MPTPSNTDGSAHHARIRVDAPGRHPAHWMRVGGDVRFDESGNLRPDANARGAFVFTGLLHIGRSPGRAAAGGLDFARFPARHAAAGDRR